MRIVLAVVAAITTIPAQEFLDLPWRVNEAGQLEVQQPVLRMAAAKPQFGPWMPMFPSLLERDEFTGEPSLPDLLEYRPISWLPLLVHGPGGAAALDESELRLKKLGLGAMTSMVANSDLPPDPLVDPLRVRFLASIELESTMLTLRRFARNEERDAFVRAAAAQACIGRHPDAHFEDEFEALLPRRGGAAMIHAALERMPDVVDLVIAANTAALPETTAAMRAWRELWLRLASFWDGMSGGAMSPAKYMEAQLLGDRPGQLPYELAARFGNFRVDTVLIALCLEQGQWWFRLGGAFQPEKVAKGVRDAGGEAVVDAGGVTRATLLDWQLRVASDHLEVWPKGMQVSSRGAWLPKLQQNTGRSAPPVWAHAPEASGIAERLGVPGCRVDASFEPWRLRAEVTCPDRASADDVLAGWKRWQQENGLDLDAKVPERGDLTWGEVVARADRADEGLMTPLRWRQLVDAVVAQQHEARVTFTLDLGPWPAIDRVRLLMGCQLRWLRDLR